MVRVLTPILTASLAALCGFGPLVVTSAAAAADAGKGRSVFSAQCSACHSNSRAGPVIVGPPLFGVVGRKAGSIPSFNYSTTMKSAGFVWTEDRLRAYLPGPSTYLPGVKMTYPGLKNPSQLDDLITYLQTLR